MTFPSCRDCDRPLRDPVSRERGYGRRCWQDHKPTTAPAVHRSPVVPRRRVSAIPGQIPLDLRPDNQETP